jgi:endonuclease YncB( thermonuclease family)
MRSALLLGAVLVGAAGWVAFDGGKSNLGISKDNGAGSFSCTVASITDGDTLRCLERDDEGRAVRVRLAGIAAREADGSCSAGHPCPVASAQDATAELVRLAAEETLACTSAGSTFGRIAAFCVTSAGVDLSCAMVASGTAARWDRYWNGHRCR